MQNIDKLKRLPTILQANRSNKQANYRVSAPESISEQEEANRISANPYIGPTFAKKRIRPPPNSIRAAAPNPGEPRKIAGSPIAPLNPRRDGSPSALEKLPRNCVGYLPCVPRFSPAEDRRDREGPPRNQPTHTSVNGESTPRVRGSGQTFTVNFPGDDPSRGVLCLSRKLPRAREEKSDDRARPGGINSGGGASEV